jgi:hypothetical protein
VVGFEESTARLFGQMVGQLERQGQVIGDMDALIASTALEQDEVLVARNTSHFQRVPSLQAYGRRILARTVGTRGKGVGLPIAGQAARTVAVASDVGHDSRLPRWSSRFSVSSQNSTPFL